MGRLRNPTTYTRHRDGKIPLSVFPKDTTGEVMGVFSTRYPFVERQTDKLKILVLKVYSYYLTR